MKIVYILIGAICGLLVILVAGLIGISYYFYNIAVKRCEKAFLSVNSDLKHDGDSMEAAAEEQYQHSLRWFESRNKETWTITSEDGLRLTAYYIPAENPTKNTSIIAHGYCSKAEGMSQYAELFSRKLGFNVLIPDARGHGRSEGDYIGFGWPERKDYLLWIGKIIDMVGRESQIALFGISMGGATVMMASGEKLPEQVKAIVEDCGYTSVSDVLSYQLEQIFKLPKFPILYTTSFLTGLKAGYNFFEASALKQVRKDKTPMLFIHGGNDTFVPTDMVYKVYEACKAEKDILIIERAGHGQSYTVDPEAYESRISEFVGKYIK